MIFASLFRRILLIAYTALVFSAILWSSSISASTDLESMTFISTWIPSGKVTLFHGEYRQPAAPESASEIVVKLTDKRGFGNINGKETGAVVLVTEAGGSGTFYELALLLKKGEQWVNTDTVLLGDRIKICSMEINDSIISLTLIIHSPQDPMCCPTIKVIKRFSLNGIKLEPVFDYSTVKN